MKPYVTLIITLYLTAPIALAPAVAQSNSNISATRPSAVQWVMDKLFGGARSLRMSRASGVKNSTRYNSGLYGVKYRSSKATLNRSMSGSQRNMLGSRPKMFSGKRNISGFKKSKGYRISR